MTDPIHPHLPWGRGVDEDTRTPEERLEDAAPLTLEAFDRIVTDFGINPDDLIGQSILGLARKALEMEARRCATCRHTSPHGHALWCEEWGCIPVHPCAAWEAKDD